MVVIYPKFYSLEPEKRERIINAALKEFARNGYEKASTNEIIKEAQISKGSLFNYFNSKKDLYFFLLDYVVEVIEEIYDEVDWNETDLFKRMREIGLIKLKIMKKFPQAFNFLKTVGNEDAAEVKSEIDKLGKHVIASGLEKGYKNIDFSKFRDDIDIQKTMNIITWTILSFAEQQRDKVNSFEDIPMEALKEWDDYFDIMKRCFYKKEEQ
ncbi:TetR/AcrR family transcriptional regulator [Geosporobacter ferrireducens]|uniref:TetR family transcriptional regulator n=1 Tax=Geosporobacter ferrireducens TaxID=1424294 RepID=A0A1D8GM15_9FIRM|nr:TetR/AcrR family transcriptional regulator [Geosporobacter ferrireducens]AOT71953.1 TetR family transcriptional regulator [Geosporobacter ferrireducens]MTI55819.1 TetR/AcrR family transcriptional regulator [Geosporobacter ferrireducens]